MSEPVNTLVHLRMATHDMLRSLEDNQILVPMWTGLAVKEALELSVDALIERTSVEKEGKAKSEPQIRETIVGALERLHDRTHEMLQDLEKNQVLMPIWTGLKVLKALELANEALVSETLKREGRGVDQ